MAKIQNVYKDNQTKKWFYKKRLPKGNPTGKEWAIKKGFATASEAKQALSEFLARLDERKINIGSNVLLETFTKEIVYGNWQRKVKKSVMVGKIVHCKHIFKYFEGKAFNQIGKKDIAG